MPDIDGRLVDEIEEELRRRHFERHEGRLQSDAEQAITSAELADQLGIDDSEAQPKTREAVKIVMRERGLPVIGGSNGYYIPINPADIEDALQTLDSRIAGIQERKHLIDDNWRNWTAQERTYREDAAATDGGDRALTPEERAFLDDNPGISREELLAVRRGGRA